MLDILQKLGVVLQGYFNFVMGWPLIIYVLAISLIYTVALSFVQFRYFFRAWKNMLFPKPSETKLEKKSDVTPMQAFMNLLNANIGNGALAGVATAICSGGPGAALWYVIMGFILMAVRFAEVYASAHFSALAPTGSRLGGPMLYLGKVPGGKILSWLYAVLCLLMGFAMACMMQMNSVALGLKEAWGVSPYIVAGVALIFVLYIVLGGAQRVAKASELLVPFKIGLFLFASIFMLAYNYHAIIPALKLIFTGAFSSVSVLGGVVGYTVTEAIRYGMMRTTMATESGLGTASILFGSTGSKEPVDDAIMSMLSTFISAVFCFTTALCLVVSGVWNCGLKSTDLVVSAYQTAFGSLSGALIVFLSTSFAAGVLVAYVYISREAWIYVFKGRLIWLFGIVYSVAAAAGALVDVDLVWLLADIFVAGMLIINLYGLLYLLPVIRKAFKAFMLKNK